MRNLPIDRGLVKNVRVVVVATGARLITVRILRGISGVSDVECEAGPASHAISGIVRHHPRVALALAVTPAFCFVSSCSCSLIHSFPLRYARVVHTTS